jgi:hypothetical protein
VYDIMLEHDTCTLEWSASLVFLDIMVAAGGINLHISPLTRLEYSVKQEKP